MDPEAPAGDSASQIYAGSRVCITGGAGFIGGWLAETLLDAGASVCVLDDLSSGNPDFIAALVDSHPERCRFVHASVLDPRSLDDAMERAQVVFHLAAIASVSASMRDPERCLDVNVRGTVETAQAARAAGARRIVFASSSAVYGDAPPVPTREDHPCEPVSPYGGSKLAAEILLGVWARAFGLSSVSLRMFNVYGPRQPSESEGDESAVVSAFAARIAAGRPPVIFGDGAQTRDFIHVRDAARAMRLAGSAEAPFRGDSFNIASGEAVTITGLARLMADAAGARVDPEHGGPRAGDIRASHADISRARAALGFAPTVGLLEGLRDLVGGSGSAGRRASA